MINFRNPGSIDIRALKTFGLTSKSGEDTIGRFGTGLKYATAVIARAGGSMTIQTGGETYTIGTDASEFRGQEIVEVTMNGEPLPYTTSLGRDWEVWMAFRELVSNAWDEGGDVDRTEALGACSEEETVISIDLQEFEAIFFSMEEHFIGREEEPIYKSDRIEVYQGRSRFVFYRGIAVHMLEEPSALRYNLLGHLDLTEDRTAKYAWYIKSRLETALAEAEDESVVRAAVDRRNAFEATLDFSNEVAPSDVFLGASVALGSNSNETSRALVTKQLPDDPDTVSIGTIAGQGVKGGEALREAIALLRALDCDLSAKTFVLAEGLSFHDDFEIKGDQVFLNEKVFEDQDRMNLACLSAFAEIEGNRWLARRLITIAKEKV